MASTWIAYNDLAWTEDWLADPAECEDEVTVYVDLITRTAANPPSTLLHLGSGAGGHDRIFKQHFTVTGVAEDAPANSTIKYNMVIPFESMRLFGNAQMLERWRGWRSNMQTYIEVKDENSYTGIMSRYQGGSLAETL